MFKPMPRTFGLLRRRRPSLLADERGATAVEFGLLAIPFFTIIAGILQTSVIFLATQVLESAVHDAARQIRTGQIQSAGGGIESFRSMVCGRLYGLFADCNQLFVDVTEVTDFTSATAAPPVDPNCLTACEWTQVERWVPGDGGKVILVQVYYRYPVIVQFGPLGMANMADGTRLMGTATVFLNEPFS